MQTKIENGELPLKISVKGLTKKLSCNPKNREICYTFVKGVCCINHKKGHYTKYHIEEISKLPEEIKNFVDKEGNVKFYENGYCSLIEYCKKDKTIMPVICRLAPLGFNKSGRLIMKRMAWLRPCPFYGKGEEAYKEMKDCLIQIFGENIYKQIEDICKEKNKLLLI